MLSTARNAPFDARKGRTAIVRPLTNLLNSSSSQDSIRDARLQRLTALCGVTGRRAELIAFLIWGEARDGE